MIVLVRIVNGPVTPEIWATVLGSSLANDRASCIGDGNVGATLRFEGIIRRIEQSAGDEARELWAIDYQTYDPMAEQELERLAKSVGDRHGLSSIAAVHSRGRVGVGEVSFVLEVSAPHRAEAIAGVTEFIDRLKQDVPIWKQPVWPG